MQWSEVTKPPKDKVLRQFAGLWLTFFAGLAAWRAWHTGFDGWAQGLAALGVVLGLAGLARPRVMRYIFTGWLIAAFPIGWTVSKVMLGAMFLLVFTPVSLLFRLTGRDALHRRKAAARSYWTPMSHAAKIDQYFRQF